MKAAIFLLAFVFAIGSAFTTKAFNVTGWANDSLGNPVSAPTNESGCALSLMTNCTITVSGTTYNTAYDAKANINNSTKVLKHN